ncbi:MAG: GatB/YqeY domain-containing protein [bacterium]
MSLAQRLQEDLHRALRAGDALRVSTIRLVRAAAHNAEIERGRALRDEELEAVITHEAKRRREAIEAFAKGGRDDLVRKESSELAMLSEYLPAPMSEDEMSSVVAETAAGLGARGERDTGKVMAAVMPKVRGRADGAVVSRLVREWLAAHPSE